MSILAKNTFFLTVASIGQKAVAFLYFVAIARFLGSEEALGNYFLALALITTIGVLDDLGLTSVIIRQVAQSKDRAVELVRNALSWKLLAFPITVFLAFLLPGLIGFSSEAIGLVKLAVFVMLADSLSVMFYGVLRGLQIIKFEALGIFTGQILTTIFGIIFLSLGGNDLRFLIGALILGSTWNAAFSAFKVAKHLSVKALLPSFTFDKKILQAGLMFFLAGVFVKLYSYVDSFAINLALGKGAVGIYSVAYKLTYAFQFLPMAFVGALYPSLSAQINDPAALKATFLRAEWYLATIGAPIVAGLSAVGSGVIELAYGAKFAGAVPVLQLLLIGLFFIFLDFPVGSLLNATHRQAQKTIIMGITMVINVVFNILLVPKLGIEGAGWSAIISFAFMFLSGFYLVRRAISVSWIELFRFVFPATISAAIMFIAVIVGQKFVPWFTMIPVGGLIFFLALFLTGGITKGDWNQVKLIAKRKYAPDLSS